MARTNIIGEDPFNTTWRPQLEQDGWIFYMGPERYFRTRAAAYTPTVLSGNPARRRKQNRPLFFDLHANDADGTTYTGSMNIGAASALNPWATGFAPPFTGAIPDEAWRIGPTGHYSPDGFTINEAAILPELHTVCPDDMLANFGGQTRAAAFNPVATTSAQFGDCADPVTARDAVLSLFNALTV